METYIFRTKTSDQGTEGILITTEGFICKIFELPWRDNQRSISCIPPGEYDVIIRLSPKYGRVYHVTNVPNRSYILMHSGNWAGDVNKGFKTHTNGCLLTGLEFGFLSNQRAILNSRVALRRFMDKMSERPFRLKIIGG